MATMHNHFMMVNVDCKVIDVKFYSGWPIMNVTLRLDACKDTMVRMKKLGEFLRIKFFSQQDDTKIINFHKGVRIQRSLCEAMSFQDVPFYLICHNLRTENFPLLGFPG